MKKLLVLCCSLFLFAAVSNAQNADTSATRSAKQWNRGGGDRGAFMKQLNLTADQQAKLKQLSEDSKTKRDAIKNNASLNDDQKKEAYKALSKENYDARQAIYTPEQKALIEKSHADRKMGGRGQGRKPAANAPATDGQ